MKFKDLFNEDWSVNWERLQKYPISASYRKLPKVQPGTRKEMSIYTFN